MMAPNRTAAAAEQQHSSWKQGRKEMAAVLKHVPAEPRRRKRLGVIAALPVLIIQGVIGALLLLVCISAVALGLGMVALGVIELDLSVGFCVIAAQMLGILVLLLHCTFALCCGVSIARSLAARGYGEESRPAFNDSQHVREDLPKRLLRKISADARRLMRKATIPPNASVHDELDKDCLSNAAGPQLSAGHDYLGSEARPARLVSLTFSKASSMPETAALPGAACQLGCSERA